MNMLVSSGFPELGVDPTDVAAVIQAALVKAFGRDAGRVAQQQLAEGQHEPQMAILWTRIADRLSA